MNRFGEFCTGFALHLTACRRNIGGIRWNPMPTEGVIASHEDKEAAHWKSREIGGACCSSHGSAHFEGSSTANQAWKGQSWQEEAGKKAKVPCPYQDWSCANQKAGKKAGCAETQDGNLTDSGDRRITGGSGGDGI
jgi:hypothetical protein